MDDGTDIGWLLAFLVLAFLCMIVLGCVDKYYLAG
ncbi:putative membrane protein [Pectobacterium phage vB_PatP_CB1]|uniref:Putative membrane protein n=1 Tax=Pectobacterium phage vB_PatP_CB1 TaxID=1958917 RepID=A0A2P0PAT8_9CAUD|nr:hypothetical protein HWB08_gp96 [Pectobacterium phage vB_PatP_CB1]ARB11823.1 putative membrane protein [Pectobacterium phage vB_PatP_CB1]